MTTTTKRGAKKKKEKKRIEDASVGAYARARKTNVVSNTHATRLEPAGQEGVKTVRQGGVGEADMYEKTHSHTG